MDIKGVKVGLVGIYELKDHLGREQQLKDNIAKVKADGAELVIVIFHWGNESETVPDTNQMTLGRLAIDEGADLVCGHHPHVLQGIETYKGKNIVYSLGNFCFGGNSSPSDMDTMIFQQTFTITSDGVQADNVTNIIPCSISSADGYNNYQPLLPAMKPPESNPRLMNAAQRFQQQILQPNPLAIQAVLILFLQMTHPEALILPMNLNRIQTLIFQMNRMVRITILQKIMIPRTKKITVPMKRQIFQITAMNR